MNLKQRLSSVHAPAFLVAEIGINHNGDLALAKKMIQAAAQAGADAVKFQNYLTEDFISDRSLTYEYLSQGKRVRESQYDMFKRCELNHAALEQLKRWSDEAGINFHSTPTSAQGIQDLLNVHVEVLKNGSDYLTHLPMIKAMAKTKLPTVLSTGMSTIEEISQAVRTFRRAGGKQLVLLHCVSSYPADMKDMHLNKIPSLRNTFKCPVGLSDHTEGIVAAIGAVALGACWIEKHFTLNKNLPGPDHRFSADPTEFAALVKAVREVEAALGSAHIGLTSAEQESRRGYRLSCVAARAFDAGHRLREEDLAFKRPGTGLPPAKASSLVGKRLRQAVQAGQILTKEYVSKS